MLERQGAGAGRYTLGMQQQGKLGGDVVGKGEIIGLRGRRNVREGGKSDG